MRWLLFILFVVVSISLVIMMSIDLVPINTPTSMLILMLGAASTISFFLAASRDRETPSDSFEDYMKSLKDRMDR